MKEYTPNITVFDPLANPKEIEEEFHIALETENKGYFKNKFDAVILAVAHNQFKHTNLRDFGKTHCVVYDVKGAADITQVDGRL